MISRYPVIFHKINIYAPTLYTLYSVNIVIHGHNHIHLIKNIANKLHSPSKRHFQN